MYRCAYKIFNPICEDVVGNDRLPKEAAHHFAPSVLIPAVGLHKFQRLLSCHLIYSACIIVMEFLSTLELRTSALTSLGWMVSGTIFFFVINQLHYNWLRPVQWWQTIT